MYKNIAKGANFLPPYLLGLANFDSFESEVFVLWKVSFLTISNKIMLVTCVPKDVMEGCNKRF